MASFMMFFSFFPLIPTQPSFLRSLFGIAPTMSGTALTRCVAAVPGVPPLAGFIAGTLSRKQV